MDFRLRRIIVFSKSLDNFIKRRTRFFLTNQTYPVDNATEYGPSDFDVTHNFNLFGLYELPFYKKSDGLAKTLLGGFEISGILTFHTGFPFTPVVSGPQIRTASGAEFGPFSSNCILRRRGKQFFQQYISDRKRQLYGKFYYGSKLF